MYIYVYIFYCNKPFYQRKKGRDEKKIIAKINQIFQRNLPIKDLLIVIEIYFVLH